MSPVMAAVERAGERREAVQCHLSSVAPPAALAPIHHGPAKTLEDGILIHRQGKGGLRGLALG